MRPYMDNGFMVHANDSLPGGFKSRVASKRTRKGLKYYHVVQDETTSLATGPENAGFVVVNSKEHGTYRMYESYSSSDFDRFMSNHRAAVETWMALYMTEGVGTVEDAHHHYERNRQALMDRSEA